MHAGWVGGGAGGGGGGEGGRVGSRGGSGPDGTGHGQGSASSTLTFGQRNRPPGRTGGLGGREARACLSKAHVTDRER